LLVAEPLVEPILSAKLSGLELRQVIFYRNNDPLPWWQLITHHCMPPMSPQTRGVIPSTEDHVVRPDFVIRAMPPCLECHRDGRYHTNKEPCEIMYSRKDVDPDSLPDFAHTWESFGKSAIDPKEPRYSRYYDPMIMVKPKVLDLFRSLKVKHVEFSPVQFID
jgi:hypothetical protein